MDANLLGKFAEVTDETLFYYKKKLFDGKIRFKVEEFKQDPAKNYSAKSESVILNSAGNKIGDIAFVIFNDSEGSGSEVDYKKADLTFAEDVLPTVASIPRKKNNIHLEGIMPIGSYFEGTFVPNLISLDETILDKRWMKVRKGWTFGSSKEKYEFAVNMRTRFEPEISFTKYVSENKTDVGNPHAIINNSGVNADQIAGFIGITYLFDNPLLDYVSKWSYPK